MPLASILVFELLKSKAPALELFVVNIQVESKFGVVEHVSRLMLLRVQNHHFYFFNVQALSSMSDAP